MNLTPNKQTKLYGLESQFNEFIRLLNENKLPNKILLSGLKGIGKCTLAYHLINYVLSIDEKYSYDLDNLNINPENRSFKLIQNGTNLNFHLIDINAEKKNIDINQIRILINNLNKSSFNSKPRFVLIDNIEYLNLNSINALLKILEEPNKNIIFILIHNSSKKIIPTLLSRCLNYRIYLSNKKIDKVNKDLFDQDMTSLINKDFFDYYYTPGRLYNLLKFSKDNEISLKNIDTRELLTILINKSYYKKDVKTKNLLYELIEFFLLKKISIMYSGLSSYFLRKINDCRKYNLDDESLFFEINKKLLNE